MIPYKSVVSDPSMTGMDFV